MSRIECENYDVVLPGGGNGRHPFTISVARNAQGLPVEIVFVGRGKSGHGIDIMFADLGVTLSRILQGRNPRDELGDDD